MKKTGWKKRVWNKRGIAITDSLFVLFEVLLIVVTGFLLMDAVKAQTTSNAVDRYQVAAGLALRTESLMAAPGNVLMLFSEPDLAFEVIVDEKNNFAVGPEAGKYTTTFSFHGNSFLNEHYEKIKTGEISLLQKEANEITMKSLKKSKPPSAALGFIPVNTEAARSQQRIVLYPASQESLTQPMAKFVIGAQQSKNAEDFRTADLLITLRTMAAEGEGKNPQPRIYIPHQSLQSRKLASFIFKHMPQQYSDGAIIPISFSYLSQEDSRNLLTGKIGAELWIPSVVPPQDVGIAIDKALTEYFQPSFVIGDEIPDIPALPGKVEVVNGAQVIMVS